MNTTPSLLPLENKARVIAADVQVVDRHGEAPGQGHVIADLGEPGGSLPYVVWSVYLHAGKTEWLAANGDYCSTPEIARHYYDRRRGVTVDA